MRKLRIAQVAPLFESVPPKQYGGTERKVSYLTEELVARGHDVTLFASGDSVTKARLMPMTDVAIRLDEKCRDWVPHHLLMLEKLIARAEDFDIVHFHLELLHFSLARRLAPVCLTTIHGRLDLPDIEPLHREFRELPLASISMSQREPMPFANWVGNVYHGLPLDLYRARVGPSPSPHLLFLGRISPEKATDAAIRIAVSSGLPLKIAAKIDPVDEGYFHSVVRPLLQSPRVEFLGEVNDREKAALLENAVALLFPIEWPEPFGLVMIEAMACGTPVIVRRRGSAPEVVDHGLTGYVIETEQEAIASVAKAREFDRARCRAVFERRFSAARMATEYSKIYESMVEGAEWRHGTWDATVGHPAARSAGH
jgi:glycosyltransferase involved in cell wall biosynthesis